MAARTLYERLATLGSHMSEIGVSLDRAVSAQWLPNGDLLLASIREQLEQRCPYPPRVEVSSLGDAAVLTGALAVGLRSALDNVFTRRSRAARS